ncbi:uncharacterized protein [Scyliorhinus torazame]|uniref:uncharacterized protein isoform X3 n=1 Tax=Scyliorhinus torazame TaxID=75743 RepID=UPI003B5A7091
MRANLGWSGPKDMIREVETRMLQTPSSQRKQEPMEPPNLIALLILFTAMLIPVQGFEIRGRKMIDFPSVINCANPGAVICMINVMVKPLAWAAPFGPHSIFHAAMMKSRCAVGPGYRGSRAVTRCVNVMSQLPCASGSTLTNSTRHLWIMTRICARPSQAPACNEVAEMWLSHPAKWLSKGIFLVCRIGFLLGGFTDYLVTQCH